MVFCGKQNTDNATYLKNAVNFPAAYIYVYMYVCICVCVYIYIYIYMNSRAVFLLVVNLHRFLKC